MQVGALFSVIMALQSAGGHADPTIQRLEFLLRARDRFFDTLLLPFESKQLTANGELAWRELGSWMAASEDRVAVAIAGTGVGAATVSWSYWGGVNGYIAGGDASWNQASHLDLMSAPTFSEYRATDRRWAGQLSYTNSPFELGLGVVNVGWGQYLSRFSDVRVLGRVQIGARDCLRVVMDMDGKKEDGLYTFPWLVDFDDRQSMLAIRVSVYLRSDATGVNAGDGEPSTDRAFFLDGVRWELNRSTEVEEVTELAPNVWVGCRGRSIVFDGTKRVETQIFVDKERARCNFPRPAWLRGGFKPDASKIRR